MRISGHKTRSVFDCYNITSEEDLKEAAKLPNEYFQKKMVTLPVTPAQYADMLESDRDLQPVEIYGGVRSQQRISLCRYLTLPIISSMYP